MQYRYTPQITISHLDKSRIYRLSPSRFLICTIHITSERQKRTDFYLWQLQERYIKPFLGFERKKYCNFYLSVLKHILNIVLLWGTLTKNIGFLCQGVTQELKILYARTAAGEIRQPFVLSLPAFSTYFFINLNYNVIQFQSKFPKHSFKHSNW